MVHLRKNEKIITIIRQHWSVLGQVVSLTAFTFTSLLIVRFYFNFNFFGYAWQVVVFIGFVGAILILYKIYIWLKNGIYVTNQRLVNHEQAGLFTKTVTELLYKDIHEIKYRQKGLPNLLSSYGTLSIRTVADQEIIFKNVPNPEEAVELIDKMRISKI